MLKKMNLDLNFIKLKKKKVGVKDEENGENCCREKK